MESSDFGKMMIPLIRRTIPSMMATDLVGVQPMVRTDFRWDREFTFYMVLDNEEKIYCSYVYKLNEYAGGEYERFTGKCVSEQEYFTMALGGKEKDDEGHAYGQLGENFKLGVSSIGVGKK